MALNTPDLLFKDSQALNTDLVFGFDSNTNGLYASPITGSVGNLVFTITDSGFPITGNQTTLEQGTFPSASQTVDLTGVESYMPYGFVITTATGETALTGNDSVSSVNNLTSLQLYSTPISSTGYVLPTSEFPTIASGNYWSPVRLLLTGEGTANAAPTDYSPVPKTLTSTAAYTYNSTTRSKFGSSSIYFDGSSTSGISASNTGSQVYTFGSNDFTIETFVYINANTGSLQTIFSTVQDWFHVMRGGVGGFGSCWGGSGSAGDYNNGPIQPVGNDAPSTLINSFYRAGGNGGNSGSLSSYGGGGGGGGGCGYYGGGGGSGGGGWWGNAGGSGAGGSSYNNNILSSTSIKRGDESFVNYDGVTRTGSSVHGVRITNVTTSTITNIVSGSSGNVTTVSGNVYKLECWGQSGAATSGVVGGAGGYSVGYFTATNNTDILYAVALTNTGTSSGGSSGSCTGAVGGYAAYIQLNNTTLLTIAGGGGGASGFGSNAWGGQTGYNGGAAGCDGISGSTGPGLLFGVRADIGALTSLLRFTDNSILTITEDPGTAQLVAGSWHHVMLVRSGATIKIVRNGIVTASRDVGTKSINGYSTAAIGYNYSSWNNSRYDRLTGNIDDMRVTVGYDQYPLSYTVPATTFATKNKSPTFIDSYYSSTVLLLTNEETSTPYTNIIDWSNTPNAITCTNGATVSTTQPKSGTTSIDLTASGATLTIPASSNFNFGTADFTIEMWVYRTSNAQQYGHLFAHSNSQTVFNFKHFGSDVYLYANSTTVVYASNALPLTTWTHLALVRSGNTFTIYVNGISAATGASSSSCGNSTSNIYIGNAFSAENFSGYIDDLRVTKAARYAYNFTPAVTPLPISDLASSGSDPYFSYVSLLLPASGSNGSTIFLDFSNYVNTVTSVGSAQVSTLQSKFGTGSIYLDGNSSLTVPNATQFEMESSDFTAECWYYPMGNLDGSLIFKGLYNTNGTWTSPGWGIRRFNNTLLRFYFNTTTNNATEIVFNATGYTENAGWNHVALTVRNGVGHAYLNGVLLGKVNGVGTIANSTDGITIGKFPYITTNLAFTGYIDEVRITKGVARYFDNGIVTSLGLPYLTTGITGVSLAGNVGNAIVTSAAGSTSTAGLVGNITTNQAISKALINRVKPINQFPDTDVGDAYFGSVTTLLRFNNSWVDESIYAHTFTSTNATISNTQSKFGETSAYFNGTNALIKTANSNDYAFGTGDFTVECWLFQTARTSPAASILSFWSNTGGWAWEIVINYDGTVGFHINGVGLLNSASAISLNTWTHIAICRVGTTTYCYINGTLSSTASIGSTAIIATTAEFMIGTVSAPNTWYYSGYIDDVRITKGVSRYTSNFTPIACSPQTLVDTNYSDDMLLCRGNAFTDLSIFNNTLTANGSAQVSTSQSKFGGSSFLLNGTTDYITTTVPSSKVFAGNWTMEAWVYCTGSSGNVNSYGQCILTSGSPNNTAANIINVYLQEITGTLTGKVRVLYGNGTSYIDFNTASALASVNTWHHIALVKNGSELAVYLNGAKEIVSASAIQYAPNATMAIGRQYNNLSVPEYFKGFIDEVRVSKVARYTSAFNVPTTFFASTNDVYDPYYSNVSLLVHGNGTNASTKIADYSSNNSAITTVGNAQISTTQSKFGGSSIYFDGTGDYLVTPPSNNYDFGTGDYTLEFWVYPTRSGLNECILACRDNNSGIGWEVYLSDTGQFFIQADSYVISSAGIISTFTWQHIAVTRSAGTTSIFLNGVIKGTTNTAITVSPNTGLSLYISGKSNGLYQFQGYIDDIRITKGVARYFGSQAEITAAAYDIKLPVFSAPLTLGAITTSVGTITPTLTASYMVKNTITSAVGNLVASQQINKDLTSPQITVYQGNLLGPFITVALTNVSAALNIGVMGPSLTDNFPSKVSSTGSVGTITTNQVVSFELVGNSAIPRVGYVGSGQLNAIVGNVLFGDTGNITAARTQDFATKNTITTGVGSITAANTTTFQINGNQTVLSINGITNTLPITGNSLSTSVGSITDQHSLDNSSTGYVGSITAKQTVTFGINGNSLNMFLGIYGIKNASNVNGIASSTSTGTIVPSLTGTYGRTVTSTGSAGNITARSELTRNLNGNSSAASVGLILQSFPSSVYNNTITSEIGNVTPSLTENFATSNYATGEVGSVIATNTQQKPINGLGYRMLCVGSVGNVVATLTSEIPAIPTIISSAGNVTASMTETFAAPVVSVGNVGSLGTQSTNNILILGNVTHILINIVSPTRFINLGKVTSNTSIGTIRARASLGVKTVASVGDIETSMDCTSSITGNQTILNIGTVRNFKYSPLYGNTIISTLGNYTDVKHSLGVRSITGVGTLQTHVSADTYPSGNQTTGYIGTVFATQTVDLTGVENTNTVNAFADVQHSLGLLSTASVGNLKYTRSYFLTGNSRQTAIGNIGTRQAVSIALTGNHTTGKLYQEMGPDFVVLGRQLETEIPRSWTINVRGEFTQITNFYCTNSDNEMIEVYFRDNIAWIKLNTPGSFQKFEAHYITEDGEYGIATTTGEVPKGAEIYNFIQQDDIRLLFAMTGIYSDGGPEISFTRTYAIDIEVDHSIERDLIGAHII